MKAHRTARSSAGLSLAEARRLAIAAQGLARPPGDAASLRQLRSTARRLGLLQIDSVNVLVRAHFMPLFSRHGPYDRDHLHAEAYAGRSRRMFEYWAHEACLIPVEMQPLFRWRMEAAARGQGMYEGLNRFVRERGSFIGEVLEAVRERGPLAASDLEMGDGKKPGWWGWSDAKTALECLFWAGRITTLTRENAGFTRIYDLTERVLPHAVLAAPTPDPAAAQRALLMHAAAALGVATEIDLREYFRLPVEVAKARIPELVEAGELHSVSVEGWGKPAFLVRGAVIPRSVAASALLSPFDTLLHERPRAERLFDFHYRIEIYTPAHKRQYGYYCLPFLLGDRIAGRFDLKADRAAGVLRVESAHVEGHADVGEVAEAARRELARMAAWLELGEVQVAGKSVLAKALGKM